MYTRLLGKFFKGVEYQALFLVIFSIHIFPLKSVCANNLTPAVAGNVSKSDGIKDKEEKYFHVEDLIRKEITKHNKKYSRLHKAYRAERNGLYEEGILLADYSIRDRWLNMYRMLLRGRLLYKSERYNEAISQITSLFYEVESSNASWCQSAVNKTVILYIDILVKSESFKFDRLILEKYVGEMPFKSLIKLSFIYRRLGFLDLVFDTLMQAYGATGEYQPESEMDSLKYYIKENLYAMDSKEITIITILFERLGWTDLTDITIAGIEKKFPDDHEIQLLKGRVLKDRKRGRSALKIFKKVYALCDEESLKIEALLNIAALHYEMGRITLSARNYRDLAREYPGHKNVKPIMYKSARIFLSCGKFNDAIEMWETARDPKFGSSDTGPIITEAVLKLWLGKKDEAYLLLEKYSDLFPENKRDALYYWLFRTAEKTEDKERWRKELIMKFPSTYFSEIALNGEFSYLIGGKGVICDGKKKRGEINKEEIKAYSWDIPQHIESSLPYNSFLFFIQEHDIDKVTPLLRKLVSDFEKKGENPASLALALRLTGMTSLVFKIPDTQSNCRDEENHSIFRFPSVFLKPVCESSGGYGISPELVLAVIRRESKFDSKAVSKAGAMGLMQLMPSTGLWIAEMLRMREMNKEELFDSDTNIKLGCWYINYLLKRNDQSFIGAISAYNAGMSRMEGWRRRFKPRENPLIALELIGIRETREYVKGVLEDALIYNKLYSGREIE